MRSCWTLLMMRLYFEWTADHREAEQVLKFEDTFRDGRNLRVNDDNTDESNDPDEEICC